MSPMGARSVFSPIYIIWMTAFVLKAHTLDRSRRMLFVFASFFYILLCVYTILQFYQTCEYSILFSSVNILLLPSDRYGVDYGICSMIGQRIRLFGDDATALNF